MDTDPRNEYTEVNLPAPTAPLVTPIVVEPKTNTATITIISVLVVVVLAIGAFLFTSRSTTPPAYDPQPQTSVPQSTPIENSVGQTPVEPPSAAASEGVK